MNKKMVEFFDLEEDEIELKEVVTAGVSLVLTLGFVFLPLFL